MASRSGGAWAGSLHLLITMWLAPPRACGALRGTRRVGYGGAWAVGRMLDGACLTSARAWRRVANL